MKCSKAISLKKNVRTGLNKIYNMAELNKNHILYKEDLQYILRTKGIEKLRGKSVLITGATGLIGTQLIDALMLIGNVHIYVVGRSREKAIKRFGEYFDEPTFHFVEQNVTKPFSKGLKVDYIIPMASNTHPMAYSKYPVETMFVNLKGAENALNLAKECGAKVVYPSSNEIYGTARNHESFSEDATGNLNLATSRACYTESKRSCEALCLSYADEYGVKVVIARLTRTFGPTMLSSDTKASSQFISRAIAHEDIILKSKGEQFFSYTYVADAVSGLLYILLHGELGQAYNISNDKCNVRLKDFAQECADYAGTKVIFDLPSKIEANGYSVAMTAILDNNKILNLGWRPKFDFRNAIIRTLTMLSFEHTKKQNI